MSASCPNALQICAFSMSNPVSAGMKWLHSSADSACNLVDLDSLFADEHLKVDRTVADAEDFHKTFCQTDDLITMVSMF